MQRKNLRIVCKILVLGLAFVCVERLCHLATDGFSILRIHPMFAINAKYQSPPPSASICNDLDQAFHYLASGSQSFAFISEDHRFVLKFFKMRPGIYALHTCLKRRHSFDHAFQSCLLYKKHLESESGMIYCHLMPKNNALPTVKLYGPGGSVCKQDLNTVPFVFQKHAETTQQYLKRLKSLGKQRQQEQAIDRLLDLMVKRYRLGFSDKDPNWIVNFGFIDDCAINLDVGGMIADRHDLTTYFKERELVKAKNKAITWLSRHNPELIPYVEKKVAEIKNDIR